MLAVAAPRLADRLFSSAEKFASAFARCRHRAVLIVALSVIVARIALLGVFPVPTPAVHDEFSYLLAADTFLHARLANPPHPVWVYLDTFHVLGHPTYASIYPPAQGGVLALGRLLGNPWIGVLFSMAVMCGAFTWMLQGWFAPKWALLGGVLAIARFGLFSYWVNSYWGGAVAATGAALVMGALPRIIQYQRGGDSVILGIGAAILANSRPLEGFLFCVPVLLALVVWALSRRGPGLRVKFSRVITPVSCVLALMVLFMGYYNWRTTGNALVHPHEVDQRENVNLPVFLWQKLKPPLHYANPQFESFYNVRLRERFPSSWRKWPRAATARCKAWWQFFLGPVLSVPFLTLPWLLQDRRMRLLWVQFGIAVASWLTLVWFEPHYAAPFAASLWILLVQGMRHLRQWHWGTRPVGVALSRAIVLILVANVPLYIVQTVRHRPAEEGWGVARVRIVQQLESTPGRHLVIVRYTTHHVDDDEWVYNAADIDHSKVVWAREIPGLSLQPLLDYFQGRQVWLLEADASPPRLELYGRPASK